MKSLAVNFMLYYIHSRGISTIFICAPSTSRSLRDSKCQSAFTKPPSPSKAYTNTTATAAVAAAAAVVVVAAAATTTTTPLLLLLLLL